VRVAVGNKVAAGHVVVAVATVQAVVAAVAGDVVVAGAAVDILIQRGPLQDIPVDGAVDTEGHVVS
jgi:hypothetical protein